MRITIHKPSPSPSSDKTVLFQKGDELLPEGRIVFSDLTRRPGRITMEIFGHRIDVMEKGVIIDGKHCPWGENQTIKTDGPNNTLEVYAGPRH